MLTLLILDATSPKSSPGPELTQYFAVCVGLIGLVLLAAWGFKRLFARSLSARAARRSLQVLDVLPLGGKQRLAVVRCYERTFVVGLGDKELCLLTELDPQVTTELAVAPAPPLPTAADQSAFRRLLRAAVPRPPGNSRAAPHRGGLSSEGLLG